MTCPSALTVEIADSSETSVPVCQNIRRHKADDTIGFFYTLLLCSALFYDLCGVCDVASVGHWFSTFRTNIVPSYSRIQVSYIYSMHLEVKTAPPKRRTSITHCCCDTPQKNGTFYLTAGRISKHGCDMLVVPKKRDKDGRRGFRFVRLEALHG